MICLSLLLLLCKLNSINVFDCNIVNSIFVLFILIDSYCILIESFLIEFIEEIGFQFVEKSNINANSKDTKDYKSGVWTLPPRLVMGEKDKKKYLAIGESDRMTLKFVK